MVLCRCSKGAELQLPPLVCQGLSWPGDVPVDLVLGGREKEGWRNEGREWREWREWRVFIISYNFIYIQGTKIPCTRCVYPTQDISCMGTDRDGSGAALYKECLPPTQ